MRGYMATGLLLAVAAVSSCGDPAQDVDPLSNAPVSISSTPVGEGKPATPTSREAYETDSGWDVSCQVGAFASGIQDYQTSDLTFRVTEADFGSVAIAVRTPSKATAAVGCINQDTAAASIENDVSFAVVQPLQDGVALLLAVPRGKQPRALDWSKLAIQPNAGDTAFDLYLASIPTASAPVSSESQSPSEQQLIRLINEAAADGTSTVAGVGPDILTGG